MSGSPLPPLSRRIGRSFLLLLVGRALTVAGTLAFLAIVTRHLGPADYGAFRTAQAWLGFVYLLANLGLPPVLLRELGIARSDRAQLLAAAIGLRLASALGFFVPGAVLALLLPFDAAVEQAILVATAGSLALSVFDTLIAVFRAELRQEGQLRAELASSLFLPLAALAVLAFDGRVVAFATVLALSQILQLVVAWREVQRLVPVRIALDVARWRALMTAALPLAVANVLHLAYYRTDTLLLSLLRPLEDVGHYGLASRLLDTAVGISILFVSLLSPLLAGGRDDPDRFRAILGHGIDAVLVGGGGVVLVLAVFGADLAASIGGPSFAAAGGPLAVLAFTFWFASLTLLLRHAVTGIDRQKELLPGYLAGVLLALTLHLLLIPPFGGIGAALGTVAGEGCLLLWTGRVLTRQGLMPRRSRTAATVLFALTMAAAVGAGAETLVPWPLAFLGSGLVYLALLLVGGAIDRDLLALLLPVAGRQPPPDGSDTATERSSRRRW